MFCGNFCKERLHQNILKVFFWPGILTFSSLLFLKRRVIYSYLNSLLIIFLFEILSALCVDFLKTGKKNDVSAFSSPGIVK